MISYVYIIWSTNILRTTIWQSEKLTHNLPILQQLKGFVSAPGLSQSTPRWANCSHRHLEHAWNNGPVGHSWKLAGRFFSMENTHWFRWAKTHWFRWVNQLIFQTSGSFINGYHLWKRVGQKPIDYDGFMEQISPKSGLRKVDPSWILPWVPPDKRGVFA